jgi:two-component system response regulator AlgR
MKVLLLVDDEPLARERLRALLMECLPQARILEATTGTEALAQVVTEGPGIVFLDIQMPGMSGLEVAQHLARIPPPPAVIFTTAYSEYALAAFEANAIDYLVKPIRRERLEQALAKAHSLGGPDLKALNAAAGQARTHLSAWHKGRMELLAVTEVLVLRADQKYVAAIHRGGTLLLDDSLKSLEEEFPERFLRLHRNTLVAFHAVLGLEKDAAGEWVVLVKGHGEHLPVSRRLAAQVRSRLSGRPRPGGG